MLALSLLAPVACDVEEDLDELRGDYPCYVTAFNPDGSIASIECEGEDPRTVAATQCYEQLMCCDKVTLGCFCYADADGDGDICPSGSLAAPAPDDE